MGGLVVVLMVRFMIQIIDSGRFDRQTFKRLFKELFVPNLNIDGHFAIIGDNIG